MVFFFSALFFCANLFSSFECSFFLFVSDSLGFFLLCWVLSIVFFSNDFPPLPRPLTPPPFPIPPLRLYVPASADLFFLPPRFDWVCTINMREKTGLLRAPALSLIGDSGRWRRFPTCGGHDPRGGSSLGRLQDEYRFLWRIESVLKTVENSLLKSPSTCTCNVDSVQLVASFRFQYDLHGVHGKKLTIKYVNIINVFFINSAQMVERSLNMWEVQGSTLCFSNFYFPNLIS